MPKGDHSSLGGEDRNHFKGGLQRPVLYVFFSPLILITNTAWLTAGCVHSLPVDAPFLVPPSTTSPLPPPELPQLQEAPSPSGPRDPCNLFKLLALPYSSHSETLSSQLK